MLVVPNHAAQPLQQRQRDEHNPPLAGAGWLAALSESAEVVLLLVVLHYMGIGDPSSSAAMVARSPSSWQASEWSERKKNHHTSLARLLLALCPLHQYQRRHAKKWKYAFRRRARFIVWFYKTRRLTRRSTRKFANYLFYLVPIHLRRGEVCVSSSCCLL